MARVNVYRYPDPSDPYAAEDGKTLMGWFDNEKSRQITEDTRWDGNNHRGIISGLQFGHECLHYTAGGRWVRHYDASREFNGPAFYEYIDPAAARDWLLRNGSDAEVTELFGEIEEEAGPPVKGGRPSEGVPISTRFRQDQLDAADALAKAKGTNRAVELRDLVDRALALIEVPASRG